MHQMMLTKPNILILKVLHTNYTWGQSCGMLFVSVLIKLSFWFEPLVHGHQHLKEICVHWFDSSVHIIICHNLLHHVQPTFIVIPPFIQKFPLKKLGFLSELWGFDCPLPAPKKVWQFLCPFCQTFHLYTYKSAFSSTVNTICDRCAFWNTKHELIVYFLTWWINIYFVRRRAQLPAAVRADELFWGLSHPDAFYEENLSRSSSGQEALWYSDTKNRQNGNVYIIQVNMRHEVYATTSLFLKWGICKVWYLFKINKMWDLILFRIHIHDWWLEGRGFKINWPITAQQLTYSHTLELRVQTN